MLRRLIALKPRFRPLTHAIALRRYASASISLPDTQERVISVLKKFDKAMPDKIALETPFAQMGLDSLDVVEVMINLEDEFHLEIPDAVADRTETPKAIAQWIYEFLNPVQPTPEDSYSEEAEPTAHHHSNSNSHSHQHQH